MAIRPVLRMGDARLLERARPVARCDTPELHALVADMQDTMRALSGAGLAAPQIGVGLQVVIFGVDHNPRYPDAEPVPHTVLVNPTLTPIGEEMEEGWEGCLSLPGMRGLVPRYRDLRYQGFDQRGNAINRLVSGFQYPIRCPSRTRSGRKRCRSRSALYRHIGTGSPPWRP